jgi:hypothetical protein
MNFSICRQPQSTWHSSSSQSQGTLIHYSASKVPVLVYIHWADWCFFSDKLFFKSKVRWVEDYYKRCQCSKNIVTLLIAQYPTCSSFLFFILKHYSEEEK